MNLINQKVKSYATAENATKKLQTVLGPAFETARYLIAVTPDGKRFVPTLVGIQYLPYVHAGIMVVG